jgi:hypothetical protein
MTTADLRRSLERWSKAPHPHIEIQFERSRAVAVLLVVRELRVSLDRLFIDPS